MKQKTYYSFAKINLGLEIVSKRPDGFHNLNSLFIPIKLFDIISIEPSENFDIAISPNKIKIPINENLIYKTIKLFEKEYKINTSLIKISLDKRIPIGAGLGGGSSNAATMIIAINEMFELNLSKEEMYRLACQIGADVPFFLQCKPALVGGKGDVIKYFDIVLPFNIFLVFPNISISTKEAYSMVKIKANRQATDLLNSLKLCLIDTKLFQVYFKNDFEEVLFEKYPVLTEVKEKLLSLGAFYASLSGSGSVIYGFFDKSQDLNPIREKFDGFWTYATEQV